MVERSGHLELVRHGVVTHPGDHVDSLVKQLTSASDLRLKSLFQVRETTGNNKALAFSPADYQNAQFVYGRYPQGPLQKGVRALGPLEFGYSMGADKFRTFGHINYMLVDEENHVLEVGGSSDKLLQEFRAHAQGRTLSPQELNTIAEINAKLFNELRENPEAQKKLKEFSEKRGWPTGLAEKAGLVYYSKEILDLKAWAVDRKKGNNYSLNQLRDAGWLLLTFDGGGRPVYKDVTSDSIKIPYYKDESHDRFELWQARMLTDDDGPKYRSWQLDRSIVNNPARVVGAPVFNWNPRKARGKTVVITEGALKCIVGEDATGVMHVGIEGISQFDSALAKAFVQSGATEFIVVLDRDPGAMDLFRTDNISVSKRAGYEIAQELVKAGATNVRIGQLPDAFDGGKVGIDDLILGRGKEPYLKTLATAITPATYATEISLDLKLQELKYQRRELKNAIEIFSNTLVQTRHPSETQLNLLREAQRALDNLNNDFKNYLATNFNGARSLTEPAAMFPAIPKSFRPDENGAANITTQKGDVLQSQYFANPILIFDYVFSDDTQARCQTGPCLSLGSSASTFEQAYRGQFSEPLKADLARSQTTFDNSIALSNLTREEFANRLLAGHLAHDFPAESYRYEFNMHFGASSDDVIPVTIFKKSSGTAVAIARLQLRKDVSAAQRQLFSRFWNHLRPRVGRGRAS